MAEPAHVSLDKHPHLAVQRRVAATPWEALQRSAPFETVMPSHLELDSLASLVEMAVSSLDELDSELLIAVVFERLTFRQAADRLGISKSTAHRRYGRICKHLQQWFKEWAIAVAT